MQIVITPNGSVRYVYDEMVDLSSLGRLHIERGSHVESDDKAKWYADLEPVSGPRLGPFEKRSRALEAEREWLARNWLERITL